MDKKKQAATSNPIYRIKDWDLHFENNRTRDLKNMAWIPITNKHDGDGYTELVDHENGAAHLGAWLVILQVASKCEIRGTLLRDNRTPHNPKTIARLSRIKEAVISDAINRLCSSDISWLEVVDKDGIAQIPHDNAPIPHHADYGTEGNGRERKGKEITSLVVSFYNDNHGKMPICRKATAKRSSQIIARVAEYGIDAVKAMIMKCSTLGFLNGDNDREWFADLEWITKDSNYTKILEGKYDTLTKSKSTKPKVKDLFKNQTQEGANGS